MKLQSAMEYLTTYGWAILIIVIVAFALFSLGIFNPYTFEPKAQPGACNIVRNSFGQGALSGTCIGSIPEYTTSVAAGGSILGPSSATTNVLNTVTISMWVYIPSGSLGASYPVSGTTNPGETNGYAILLPDSASKNIYFLVGNTVKVETPAYSAANTLGNWVNIVGTYSGTAATLYVNGVAVESVAGTTALGYSGATSYIIDNPGSGPIMVSNIQVYNASISAAGVQSLYIRGIGGIPIQIQNLVAWWPLNGNTNDYSGDGNNAASSTGISYQGNWYNDYVQP